MKINKTLFYIRCAFNKKYRKVATCICLLIACCTILGLYFNAVVSREYVYVDSGDVLHVFSIENTKTGFETRSNLSRFPSNGSNGIADIHKVVFNKEFRNITLKPETARLLNSRNRSYASTLYSSYLIENKHLCDEVEELTVVIMVHTAPKNYENRMAIRRTWANNSYYPELGNVRTLFLLGMVNNHSLQLHINQEFKEHGDLVQGDFIDAYYNMTLKGVMGYKWLSERCKNAKIILKVDDDVIINIFLFLKKFAPTFLSKKKHIACRRLPTAKIERRMNSKWFVGNDIFKGQHFYPPFCQGFMVAISNDVTSALFQSSAVTPFFWIDDIFLYGLVPANVPAMTYTNLLYGKSVIWGAEKGIICYKRNNCNYLAILLWSDVPNKMDELWTLMRLNYNSSSDRKKTTK